MYQTRNDLPDNVRNASISLLQVRLADAIDLGTQLKQAHWNVKGPSFIALHGLFDNIADHAAESADLIAERITALGGTAEGTATIAAERSTLPAYSLDIASGSDHVEAISIALSTFARAIRLNIDNSAEIGDQTTADVFTEISRGVDKDLWFVEAHAQTKK